MTVENASMHLILFFLNNFEIAIWKLKSLSILPCQQFWVKIHTQKHVLQQSQYGFVCQ